MANDILTTMETLKSILPVFEDNIIEKVNGDFDNYNHYKALSNNSYSKNLNREELISF